MNKKLIVRFRIPKPLPIRRDIGYRKNPFAQDFREEFFDNGADQLLLAHAILDQIALHDQPSIHLIIDKEFLKRIVRSHILQIRQIA